MKAKGLFKFDLINQKWRDDIKNGKKTVDARVNIAPYADVKKGDIICYHGVDAVVKRINAYPGLNDLLQAEGFKKVVPEARGINEAIRILRPEIHGIELPHGLLAFEIEPLPKEVER
jgi:ASC-1-like (ASCH) protein